ncbi:MAG TPA: cupin domain-containing protein [Mycobacterium sp.]|nr:cupin domain-containing protein [Mycobacterium sp.]
MADQEGQRVSLGPGSLRVLPRGWRDSWVVRETIRKSYITVDH